MARFARRLAPRTTVVNLEPNPETDRCCDLTLSSAGEIRYFFDLLRYLAGRPGDAVDHQLPGHLS